MDGLNSSVPDFDSDELKELKQKLVDSCHILDREGITDGFGHVSVRIRNRGFSYSSQRKPRLCDFGSAGYARFQWSLSGRRKITTL